MILGHTTPSSSILSSKDQDRINDGMEGIGQDLRVGDLPRVRSILAMSALMLAQGFFVDKHAAASCGRALKEHFRALVKVVFANGCESPKL